MNQQPQQKASNKRTGKKITFFNDQQGQLVSSKEAQLKEQQFYGPVTRLPVSQASDNMMNTVMYPQERPDAVRVNQQPVPGKWNVPERNDPAWQTQPASMWHRNTTGYGVQMVNTYHNHQELLKRSQDKGVGVSQAEMYEGEIQQMRSKQVAQLQQQAFARQQAHLNSILQAQHQQQQQQQQQQQNQQLSLQPFQMAFGHQGHKHALQELFHVFPDATTSAAYATQQKQQTALPQMQLFENFYPSQQQQQQQQQQQAPYGMQQAAAQSHGAVQQKMHVVSQSQHAAPPEEYMKTLAEQSQHSVLPKTQIPIPRRSRRLSKEGIPPPAPSEMAQTNNLYTQNPYEHLAQQQTEAQERYKRGIQQQIQRDAQLPIQDTQYYSHPDLNKPPPPQNGSSTEVHNTTGAVTGGVIQTTRRRRRISQEANLFTLAQKAAEMPSLENTKDGDMGDKKKNVVSNSSVEFPGSTKRARGDSDMRPLVIPVSVPVKMDSAWEKAEDERTQKSAAFERDSSATKPSVIVTRHRTGHTNLGISESTLQANDGSPASEGDTVSRKPKQRPRPEPLFIPPKPGTFIVPVVCSNITPYQSHLRSPVRVPDHPGDRTFELPPYTPPPILSPVREGSGLYFNTIMSAGANSMPPPITPKSSTRTLLRSNSIEDMPPLLTAIGEATPVSIEPRINIGPRFQADIPEPRDRSLAMGDKHKADLVWGPWEESENNQGKVDDLLTAACSSILPGGGTNQELALHYLHESRGDILAALTRLLLKKPRRSTNHPLADYHYSGSDKWSASEKKLFNKGMAIYKKDFLLVQKLIKTKTVAQCVEFYYTYKKQVKIGRNGMLIFGDVEASGDERNPREDSEVDIKSSHRLAAVIRRELANDDTSDEEKESVDVDEKIESLPPKITQTLEASQTGNDTIILRNQGPDTKMPKPRGRKPRKKFPPDGIKKPEAGSKPQEPEGSFPCKKCGRVFLKVKSRSAHMKSHAEQEKKAAAQRQNELAAAQAAAHARLRHAERSESESTTSDGSDSSSESCDSSDDGEI